MTVKAADGIKDRCSLCGRTTLMWPYLSAMTTDTVKFDKKNYAILCAHCDAVQQFPRSTEGK